MKRTTIGLYLCIALGCSGVSAQETPDKAPPISRENTDAPIVPELVDCYQDHTTFAWGKGERVRDVVVTVNYTMLPFEVDTSPRRGVKLEGFRACVMELIRDAKIPINAGKMWATGFRFYVDGTATTTIPKTQGTLTLERFREILYPPDSPHRPGSNLNRCIVLHGDLPVAAAIVLAGDVRGGKLENPEILASTLRQPKPEACMMQVWQAIPFPEDVTGTIRWTFTVRTH